MADHQKARVQRAIANGGIKQISQVYFDTCDGNRDGCLEMNNGEFVQFMFSICREFDYPKPDPNKLYNWYTWADSDRKGFLNFNDAHRVVLSICDNILGKPQRLDDHAQPNMEESSTRSSSFTADVASPASSVRNPTTPGASRIINRAASHAMFENPVETHSTTMPTAVSNSISGRPAAVPRVVSFPESVNVALQAGTKEKRSVPLAQAASRRSSRSSFMGVQMLASNHVERTKLVIITDPGQDLDDEMTFILLRCLQELGLVDTACVITNLHPSFKRALLCRGALDMLGMHDVPVGYGSDGGDTAGKHGDDFRETAPYMPSENSQQAFNLPAGRTLLHRVFTDAPRKSLSILVISSLKDAAGFLRDNEDLFAAKVKDVTIMGGISFPVGEGKMMEPDTAHNNEFDRPAAEFFYRRIQELAIQTTIVSRNAAYACPVPREVYDELAQSGSPIGWRLRNAQRTSIEGLWKRAASDDPGIRMGLPGRCDAQWFKKTFCGNNPVVDERGPNDPIWDMVVSFNMYDSIALIAAISTMRRHLFTPFYHEYLGVQHMVIGASKDEIGASKEQAQETITFLNHAYKLGICLDHHHKTQIIISTTVQPGIADTFIGLALLRTLIETDTMDCLGIVISSEERYIAVEKLEEQADKIREGLADLGIQAVKVVIQHPSIRENRLEELYEAAPPTGVRLLITHALTDAASFAMMAPNLFRDKTLSVVMKGGVLCPTTPGEMLYPDMSVPAVASDPGSATFFVYKCQELGVPLTVVCESAGDLSRMPRAAFDVISTHGGNTGKRIVEEIQRDVEWMHDQVMMSFEDKRRVVPQKHNQAWFEENFCNARHSTRLWDRISAWNLDIPSMILAAVPKINAHFFEMTEWQVRGTNHILVGFDNKSRGNTTANAKNFKQFVFHLIFKGILLNLSEYSIPKFVEVPGVGSFATSDTIPEMISVTRHLQNSMQDAVKGTFLRKIGFDLEMHRKA